jgi:hypothetical protein
MKPTIQWKDGLPTDPLEAAQIEAILQSSGLSSVQSSLLRLLDGDSAAVQAEMARIAEERQRAALRAAPQAQSGDEGEPGKADLARRQADRGESGTADDRGGLPGGVL